jgi:uncharacterized protein
VDADAVEIRVLGCLIEKQRATPGTYPLSLNSLRLACNQSTNREPVVEYEESTIRAALERLSRKGWVRLASGAGSRAAKYRHLLDEALGVSGSEISVLAVLMLRGPQTTGELKQRSARLHPFETLAEIDQLLAGLAERGLAAQIPRRPGQKEQRYQQLLGEEEPADGEGSGRDEVQNSDSADRLDALEARVTTLEGQLAALRERLERSAPDQGASGLRDARLEGR